MGQNVPEENIRGAVEGAFQLEQALAAVRLLDYAKIC